jgi:hypothetical protein
VPTPGANGSSRSSSLGEVAKGAAEEALNLLSAQIKLARLELSADLRRGIAGVVRIAVFVPPLVVGYAFAMAALASWLGRFWSRPAALASVAALQIVPAVLGVLRGVTVLRRARVLARAGSELADGLQRTLAVISQTPRSPDA